jgi:hypothetical protein
MPPPVGPGDPADGLSRLIAVMRGEEAFIDVNGNGVYDPGYQRCGARRDPGHAEQQLCAG